MSFRWKFEPFLVILKIAIRLLFTACTDCKKPFFKHALEKRIWKTMNSDTI